MVEGARLHKRLKESRLLVSVPGDAPVQAKHRFLEQVAGLFGLDPARLSLMGEARTTADEARLSIRVVGDHPCLVVSDAMHLRRAIRLFEEHGVHAVPAPSSFVAPRAGAARFSVLSLFPSSGNMAGTRRAIHEWLGLLWAYATGA
jgi:uncharacterized SAM-binding protein YcdF (DUF218 family)